MPQRIIVPVFPGPPDHHQPFVTLKDYAPTVKYVVLDIELFNQYPLPPDLISRWGDAIHDYQSAGIRVLGYVPTDSGTSVNNAPIRPGGGGAKEPNRSLANIKGFIDQWFTQFSGHPLSVAPDGIFFDEGPALYRFTGRALAQDTNPLTLHDDVKNFYRELFQYAKNKLSNSIVMVNAAYYNEDNPWLTTSGVDIAILWEETIADYLPGASTTYPANPPVWWTSFGSDHVMHTVWDCQTVGDMCLAVEASRARGAGFVYVFHGTSASYGRLPHPYWKEEVAAVALRDNNDVHVRDWTQSPSSYDQGYEPSTREFWTTSDVWNRTAALPGQFDAYDRPPNEEMALDQGQYAGYAFARLHRKPCGGPLTVEASFLRADFGTSSNFEPIASPSSVSATFNQGDAFVVTPGLQWVLPPTYSGHICLAVEVLSGSDPLKNGSLLGRANNETASVVTGDNNKAQRNLGKRAVLSPGLPRPFYGIVHNGQLHTCDIELRFGISREVWRVLGAPEVEVLDASGVLVHLRIEPGSEVVLEAVRPLENRWVALAFEVLGGKEGQLLPVDVSEVAEGRIVNGFTVAAQVVGLDALARDNLGRHASEFRRLSEGFGRDDAADEWKTALTLYREEATRHEYFRFLEAHVEAIGAVLAGLLDSHSSTDPFGLLPSAQRLTDATSSGEVPTATDAHADILHRLDAFLTMQRKANGDTADILQTIRWQAQMYAAIPQLRSLECASTVVGKSHVLAEAYLAGEVGNDEFKRLAESLVEAYLQTQDATREHGIDLSEEVIKIEQGLEGGPAGLQKANYDFLLKLNTLGGE